MTSSPSSRRRVGGFVARAAAASALVVGTVGLAAVPAQAATINNWTSAPAGVPQTITINGMTQGGVESGACTDPSEPFVPTINGVQQAVQYVPVANGTAVITYAPTVAGTASWTMGGGGTGSCDLVQSNAVTISQVATTVTVDAPNTATVGQSVRVQAIVQSASPSQYQPTGTITITDANGASLSGAMGLTPGPGNGQSYAYFNFTPKAAGNYYFKAQYNGDANAKQSPISPLDTMIATPSGNTIAISAPPTMTQGQSVTLTATVYPAGTQGSVGFTINGAPISASIPINAQGQASMTWTPSMVGTVTLGASYTTNAGGTGSTSQSVVISGGPAQADVITLVQPGYGPWNNGGNYPLGNGTSFTFQATALSGAAVTLSETGPCGLNGLTLNVPVGSGQCNLQAKTNGGNGYAPATYGYTVTAVPGTQVATVAAPLSGSFKAGRSLLLEAPGQADTNAGQNINWTVSKGNNRICKLQYPSDGSVTLKLLKKGHCMVKANAPGVAGQWNPYNIKRSYHAF